MPKDGMITEEDLKRWEILKKQDRDLEEWEKRHNQEAKLALERWLANQHPLTNPPSSSRIPESGEKLSLQIRIIGEQSSGVRLLKKEYLIELPCSGVELGKENPTAELVQLESGTWVEVAIPLNSPKQPSNSPKVITPPQHESKVIG